MVIMSDDNHPTSSSPSEEPKEHSNARTTPTKRRHIIKAKNVKPGAGDGTVKNSPFAKGIDFIGRLSKRSKVKAKKELLSTRTDSDVDQSQNATGGTNAVSELQSDNRICHASSTDEKKGTDNVAPKQEAILAQNTQPSEVGNKNKKSKAKKTEKRSEGKPKVSAKKDTKPTIKSHVLTDYYPVRRSSRKTKSLLEKEQNDFIVEAIESKCEDGLSVVEFEGKGRGVVAKRAFRRGSFIVEYSGDLINWTEAKQREQNYSKDPTVGCYMYYFVYNNKNYCVDATSESGRLGRLLNHSRRNPNCKTKLVPMPDPKEDGTIPRLVIIAKRDINPGEELTYDYGDKDKETLQSHPWLKST